MVNGWLHPPTAWVLFLQPPWHTTCLRAWPGERLVEHLPVCDCRKPEQTALIDGISGEVTSREKLREGILRMSSSFKNLLEPGSTVAVSLPNIPQVDHGSTFCPSVLSHRQCSQTPLLVPAACAWGNTCRFSSVSLQPNLHPRGDQVPRLFNIVPAMLNFIVYKVW